MKWTEIEATAIKAVQALQPFETLEPAAKTLVASMIASHPAWRGVLQVAEAIYHDLPKASAK